MSGIKPDGDITIADNALAIEGEQRQEHRAKRTKNVISFIYPLGVDPKS